MLYKFNVESLYLGKTSYERFKEKESKKMLTASLVEENAPN